MEVRTYTRTSLRDVIEEYVGRAIKRPQVLSQGVSSTKGIKSTHLDYFESYFEYFKAKYDDEISIVVEDPYIDQDYMDDYASYYVRCRLGKYQSACARLHFFALKLDRSKLIEAAMSPSDNFHDTLQERYLGFVVIKPLPSTVIGKTCLKTYDCDGRRHYSATREYPSNILGMGFRTVSLAFQEQDTVAAACATSALWSVLHGTGVLFQHSIPSPVKITRLATENGLSVSGRALPNKGLYPAQMSTAIRMVGLEPEMLGVERRHTLQYTAYAYLRAGIPLVLVGELLDRSSESAENTGSAEGTESVDDPRELSRGGHAVGLTGFSLGGQPTPYPDSGTLLRSSMIDGYYVHDDQVGPFARCDVRPGDGCLETSWSSNWPRGGVVMFKPETLILPLYHKIRLSVDNMIEEVLSLDAYVERIRKRRNDGLPRRLEWDVFLDTGVALKQQARGWTQLGSAEREEILLECLPRFIWRLRALDGDDPVFEVLHDATDIEQGDSRLRLIVHDRTKAGELQLV